SAFVADERARQYAAAIGQSFREAFVNVWSRIPAAERCELLHYWSRQPMFLRSGEPFILAKIKPLIQILDNSAPLAAAGCQRGGLELNFHAWLAREHPDELVVEIARALAQVSRLADSSFWATFLKEVDRPMDRWEARHPGWEAQPPTA